MCKYILHNDFLLNGVIMKKLILTGLFFASLSFSLFAQYLPSITIVNNTGHRISQIYIRISGMKNWGTNLLGKDENILNNQVFNYRLTQPINRINSYDIMIVNTEGDLYTKLNITVSNNSRIIFTSEDFGLGNSEDGLNYFWNFLSE